MKSTFSFPNVCAHCCQGNVFSDCEAYKLQDVPQKHVSLCCNVSCRDNIVQTTFVILMLPSILHDFYFCELCLIIANYNVVIYGKRMLLWALVKYWQINHMTTWWSFGSLGCVSVSSLGGCFLHNDGGKIPLNCLVKRTLLLIKLVNVIFEISASFIISFVVYIRFILLFTITIFIY